MACILIQVIFLFKIGCSNDIILECDENRALLGILLYINVDVVEVSHRVSELVLENHPAYAAELDRVMELERCLQDASDICVTGRRSVSQLQTRC